MRRGGGVAGEHFSPRLGRGGSHFRFRSAEFRDGRSGSGGGYPTSVLPAQLLAREAALLVHLSDHVGDTELAAEDVHSERDLPDHHGPVSLLPAEPAALAELHQAQSVVQRLFCQGTAVRRKARYEFNYYYYYYYY